MQRRLGAGPGRIDGRRAGDDVVVDPVLGIRRPVAAPQAVHVGLVVAEQRLGAAVSRRAPSRPGRRARPPARHPLRRSSAWSRPGSHDQRLRNHSVGSTSMLARSGPALRIVIADAEIVGRRLGVVDGDVPVAPVGEHTGVEQLVLADRATAPGVLGNQVGVGETPLAGTRSASASTSASASSPGTTSSSLTSSPWLPS